MPKILLLQFDTDPDCVERRGILEKTGLAMVVSEPRWPTFFDVVTARRPDVIVVACSRLPSHAFECARYLGEGFNTRDIPVFLVDVLPKDLPVAKKSAPRATIVERKNLAVAVQRSLQPQIPR